MVPRRKSGETEPPIAANWYIQHSTLGVQFTLMVVLFGLAGRWLDKWIGFEPWGLIGGLCFGFVGGFLWLYRRVYSPDNSSNSSTTSSTDESEER